VNRDVFVEYIESLPLANTPDVFGLHPNAEIGYYTTAVKDMWTHLIDLQPQTAGDAGGISREDFIAKIASDIQGKLPALFDVELIKKNYTEIQPTTVVLLQELDRFNVLIKKMSTSLVTLQRVRIQRN
jgi:dynein heavy chain